MNTFLLYLVARLRPAALIALLVWVVPAVRSAEPKAGPDRPLLWKIGTPKPSYVFGTIHISDPRVLNYGPAVSNTLAAADVVVTEMDLDKTKLMSMAQRPMNAPKPLTEVLSSNTCARLDQELKRINPALSVEAFNQMQVWAMSATVSLLEEQLKNPGDPLDLMLAENARRGGKATAGLETVDEQIGTFDQLSLAEQVKMLEQSLDMMETVRKEGRSPIDDLKKAYLAGDEDLLMQRMNEWMTEMEPAEREKFLKLFLADRNVRMAERMQKMIKEQPDKTFFVAVGSAHLPGETGLLKLLEKAGYDVSRVEDPKEH